LGLAVPFNPLGLALGGFRKSQSRRTAAVHDNPQAEEQVENSAKEHNPASGERHGLEDSSKHGFCLTADRAG